MNMMIFYGIFANLFFGVVLLFFNSGRMRIALAISFNIGLFFSWKVALGVLAVYLIFNFIHKEIKHKKDAEAHLKWLQQENYRNTLIEQKNQQKQLNRQQKQFRQYMTKLVSDSIDLFEEIPKLLLTAEKHLDEAEVNFEENAFSPFWNSVEQAATQLAFFNEKLQEISYCLDRYTDITNRYKGTSSPFPIDLDSIKALAIANTTNDRMNVIVRKAECNFEFASIFEQRKTNQLLIAGFDNLADALNGLGWRLETSINSLGNQLSVEFQRIARNVEGLNSTLRNDASQRSERQKRALQMLDNIQRRRKPQF